MNTEFFKGAKFLGGRTEEEVYNILGLLLSPELRENTER